MMGDIISSNLLKIRYKYTNNYFLHSVNWIAMYKEVKYDVYHKLGKVNCYMLN